MSLTRDFGMKTVTYPVLSEGPEAVKLNFLLVELKANSVMVELELTENRVSSEYGVKAKLTVALIGLNAELPVQLALTL